MRKGYLILSLLVLMLFIAPVQAGEVLEYLERFDRPSTEIDYYYWSGDMIENSTWWYYENVPDNIYSNDLRLVHNYNGLQTNCDNEASGGDCPTLRVDKTGINTWIDDEWVVGVRTWFLKDFSEYGGTIKFQIYSYCNGNPVTGSCANNETQIRAVLYDENGARSVGEWYNNSAVRLSGANSQTLSWNYRGDTTGCPIECGFTNETGWDENNVVGLSFEIQPITKTSENSVRSIYFDVVIDEIRWLYDEGTPKVIPTHEDGSQFPDNTLLTFSAQYRDDINWTAKFITYDPEGNIFGVLKAWDYSASGGTISWDIDSGNLPEEFWVYYIGNYDDIGVEKTVTIRHKYTIDRDVVTCVRVAVFDEGYDELIHPQDNPVTTLFDKNNVIVDVKGGNLVTFCGLSTGDAPYKALSEANGYGAVDTPDINVSDAVINYLPLGSSYVDIIFRVKNSTGDLLIPPNSAKVILNGVRGADTNSEGIAEFKSFTRNRLLSYLVCSSGYDCVEGSEIADFNKEIPVTLYRSEAYLSRTTDQPDPYSDEDFESMLRTWIPMLFYITFLATTMFMFKSIMS